jgi:cardiolipin synthase
VYDTVFCAHLEKLIQSYLNNVDDVNAAQWAKRPRWRVLLENLAHLTSPLL